MSGRYSRQVRFGPLGEEGQLRLAEARVAVVGCGAIGGASAEALARAGVGERGFLRLIDRDVPEESNLPRQILFDEADVAAGLPKPEAARRRLAAINSRTRLEAVAADLTHATCDRLLADCTLVVDGSDSFETRFLLNEWACRQRVPWVHGGAIGAEGRVLAVVPGRSACLRCLVPEPPPAGVLPTCETAGILGPAAMVVGAVQAAEAMRLIVEGAEASSRGLLAFDLWGGSWKLIDLSALAGRGCPTCRAGDYPWLEGRLAPAASVLCGADAVQITAATSDGIPLAQVAERLAAVGPVSANPWLVRAEVEPGIAITVFADGRRIVHGTRDESRARSLAARYLGG
jgi:molybdopterin/thiamine biosynthesis adenylyltransferase